MKRFPRLTRRFIFAATLALMLSGAFLPSGLVNSKPAVRVYYAKEIRYYSDASYTYQVGTGYIYCNGTSTLEGTTSRYRQEDIIDVCCGSVPC